MGHEIATKVSKEVQLTVTFDKVGGKWKAPESTVPSFIVRSAFILGTHVSLSIMHERHLTRSGVNGRLSESTVPGFIVR